jgi:predicted RNase H-like nuclease (RuvC/YqgF family)
MSEYPWDIENMMLAQHDQPCDCAICDQIHFNRETRRRKRKEPAPPSPLYGKINELKCVISDLKREVKEKDAEIIDCEDRILRCNQAWESATGASYPAHAAAKIAAMRDKCNIYKCMDRKDLKLRIEQLENMHKEIVKECINIIKDHDKEGDAEATLCGYVFASSVICAIKRKFGIEI